MIGLIGKLYGKWEGKINDKKKQHEDEIIKTMLSEINQTSEDNTFNANDCIVKENSESLSENKKEKMNEPVLLQNVEKGKEDSEFTIEKTQEHFFVLNDVDESFPTFNTVKKERRVGRAKKRKGIEAQKAKPHTPTLALMHS